MTAIDRLEGLTEASAIKAPCRVATTANITLNGLQAIDGVTVASGDRVLVWNQTDTTANGIYVADTGDWTRDADFDGSGDAMQGTIVLVYAGTQYGATIFEQTAASPVPGTSAITFAVAGAAALALASSYMRNTFFPLTTAAAALSALGGVATSTLTTNGDLFVRVAGSIARLAKGADGTTLGMVAGAQAWVSPASAPTTQNLTSGTAATYTTPANVKWIKVRMVGGGGGGGGAGGGGTGGTGTATSFNSVNANPGAGGLPQSGAVGGAGGTSGTGTATLRVAGAQGDSPAVASGSGHGGHGGNAPFFGGGGPTSETVSAVGAAGVANTGGGGAGATGDHSSFNSANGGGSGEYVELIIASPSATYSYTVGTGGTAGTGTVAGGVGGTGFITVEEHYGA